MTKTPVILIATILSAAISVECASAQNYCPDTTLVTASPATGEELYTAPLGTDDWDQNARNLSAICRGETTPRATTLPATCSVGQIFFDTDAAIPGFNLFGCTSADTWTLLGDGGEGGGGAVSSVFGRTGVVVAAVSDYDASQVDNDSGVTGATVAAALNTLDSGKASTDHSATHHQAGSDAITVESLASVCGAGAPIEGDGAGGAQCGTDDAGTDDQTGAEVEITDAGTFFTATNVEGALQEIGPTMTDARTPTAHSPSHEENGGDELLVENQGTGCTDGQLFKADATGGVVCGSAGSAAFLTLDDDYGDETVTSVWNLSGALIELPNSTSPTSTDCDDAAEAGRVHVDTDAPTGEQLYICEGVTGWVLQGGGGGGDSPYTGEYHPDRVPSTGTVDTDEFTSGELLTWTWGNQDSATITAQRGGVVLDSVNTSTNEVNARWTDTTITTSANFSIAAKIDLFTSTAVSTDRGEGGIALLATGTTATPTRIVGLSVSQIGSGLCAGALNDFSSYTATTATTYSSSWDCHENGPIYVLLTYTSSTNVITGYISRAGYRWTQIATITLAGHPTDFAGIFVNGRNQRAIVRADWWRSYSSSTQSVGE